MMDDFLDFAVANSALFGIGVIVAAGSVAFASYWVYGRIHERRMRRRGPGVLR